MARVYATADDVTGWVGGYPPVNVAVLCARASEDVDTALVGAVYDTDTDGTPTDPTVAGALRDAVCAQVDSWWPRDPKTMQRLPADRLMPVPPGGRELCTEAVGVLRVAGLLPVRAVAW